jgi:choice-of-anchor C domain-containing protein
MMMAGLAVVLAVAAEGRANIIVNGSFESGISVPPSPPGYRTLSGPTDPGAFGGTTDITGWTVMNSNIDWIHNDYWQASSGTYSLDLSGWTPGGIQQTVATVIGETYTLMFDYSVNPDLRHSDTARRLDIFVNDGTSNILDQNVLVARGTRTFQDMQWQTISYTFVATSSNSTVQFVSSPSNIDAGGPAIDNVSLTGSPTVNPIPAPPAVVLAGMGGLGFLAIRRRAA